MKTEILTYLKKHWFKVSLIAILVFVAFKKDLSFHLNLNTPVRSEQPLMQEPEPVQSASEEHTGEVLTEKLSPQSEPEKQSMIDRFKFPSMSKEKKIKRNAYEELETIDEAVIGAYLKRFARVAIGEQEKFGIPASIILGNALLMSKAGKRDLAEEGHNHFGLMCTEDWLGESGRYDNSCYRHYENAWTSFRDHSLYLTTGEMTEYFKKLKKNDYKNWAKALEKADFCQERDYARLLTRLIDDYQLYELDG